MSNALDATVMLLGPLLPITYLINDVNSPIDMVHDHVSHLWRLLQQCHYLGATDPTTSKLWICAYFLPISTHFPPWSSQIYHLDTLWTAFSTTSSPHYSIPYPGRAILSCFVAQQCSICLSYSNGRSYNI